MQLEYEASCLRRGIALPEPETPRSVALRQHEREWQHTALPDWMAAQLAARIAPGEALPAAERAAKVVAIQHELGWAALVRTEERENSTGAAQSRDRRAFVEREGKAEYERLVAQAALVDPAQPVPRGVLVDLWSLRALAHHGDYRGRERQARAVITGGTTSSPPPSQPGSRLARALRR